MSTSKFYNINKVACVAVCFYINKQVIIAVKPVYVSADFIEVMLLILQYFI
jgi:hypothetical protein